MNHFHVSYTGEVTPVNMDSQTVCSCCGGFAVGAAALHDGNKWEYNKGLKFCLNPFSVPETQEVPESLVGESRNLVRTFTEIKLGDDTLVVSEVHHGR